jgi:mono/diheme cytochrome c family protein
MPKTSRCGKTALALAGLAATPVLAGDIDTDLAARGKALVYANCARCHATGLDDASPHEKAPPFRRVVEIYPSEDLAEALAEGIVSGHPDMPVFVFKTGEIEEFLAYLNSLYEAGKSRGSAE